MKLLEISGKNTFDDGTDYLVSLELSAEEKTKIEKKFAGWKNAIDSVVAHVWAVSEKMTGVDLSLFDGNGDWQDGRRKKYATN